MAKDEFKNLGFGGDEPTQQNKNNTAGKTNILEKNELKW
jgi:hypothetical protein